MNKINKWMNKVNKWMNKTNKWTNKYPYCLVLLDPLAGGFPVAIVTGVEVTGAYNRMR